MSEVKPLEWWQSDTGDFCADTVVGRYQCAYGGADQPIWVCTSMAGGNKFSPFPKPERAPYETLNDAQAAAQADYEARILSALNSTPSRNEGLPEYPWQDSETAPRDGSEFIARNDGYLPFSCHFWQEEFCHYEPDDGLIRYPFTSWMPIEATDPSALNAPSRNEVLEEAEYHWRADEPPKDGSWFIALWDGRSVPARWLSREENEWNDWEAFVVGHGWPRPYAAEPEAWQPFPAPVRALKSRGDHG